MKSRTIFHAVFTLLRFLNSPFPTFSRNSEGHFITFSRFLKPSFPTFSRNSASFGGTTWKMSIDFSRFAAGGRPGSRSSDGRWRPVPACPVPRGSRGRPASRPRPARARPPAGGGGRPPNPAASRTMRLPAQSMRRRRSGSRVAPTTKRLRPRGRAR